MEGAFFKYDILEYMGKDAACELELITMRFQKGLHVIAILAIVAASGCVQEPKRVDVSSERGLAHCADGVKFQLSGIIDGAMRTS
ncbi:hypothetical protein [Paenibacillus favisporus]|uniref:hypothetical protein n=1 Tax=Paenibacillus favisporus TaxID=221028 RepID=UPI00197D40D9|nr:hypothetical protein [Paenibacillus favisporus]